jgi:hypothetical protein
MEGSPELALLLARSIREPTFFKLSFIFGVEISLRVHRALHDFIALRFEARALVSRQLGLRVITLPLPRLMPVALHLLDEQRLLAVDGAVVEADVSENVRLVPMGGVEVARLRLQVFTRCIFVALAPIGTECLPSVTLTFGHSPRVCQHILFGGWFFGSVSSSSR